MKKLFVPYELALALKELGFDEICLAYYYADETLYFNSNSSQDGTFIPYYYRNSSNMWKPLFSKKSTKEKCCSTPTYQQAFEWYMDYTQQ